MKKNIKKYFINVFSYFEILRMNFITGFIFELIYNVIFFYALGQIGNLLVELCLSVNGYSYLTKENIFEFLKTPVTIIIFTLFIVVLAFFTSFEVRTLKAYFNICRNKEKTNIPTIVFYGKEDLKELIKSRGFLQIFIDGIVLLLSKLFSVYLLFNIVGEVKYLVASVLAYKSIKSMAVIFVTVMILSGLILSFTIYLNLNKTPNLVKNIKKSISLFKSKVLEYILNVILLNGCIIGLYYLLYLLVTVIEVYLVKNNVEQSMALAVMLILTDYTHIVLFILTSAISAFINISLIGYFFYSFEENKEEKLMQYEKYHPRNRKSYLYFVTACLIVCTLIINMVFNISSGTAAFVEIIPNVQITAHRGDSVNAPENTIPAVLNSIDNMADYVEIDVRSTKDNKLILMHDSNLYRTTGKRAYVSELTLRQIEKLDAGAWFDPEFAGTRVPTFEEVLDICKDKIKINVEVKYSSSNDKITEDVIALIKEYNMEDQCVITSQSKFILYQVKEIDSNIRTGYIVTMDYGNYYYEDDIDFYSMSAHNVTDSKVQLIHSYGKEVYVWTVNSRGELNRMQRINVDNVITDNPILAREILQGENLPDSILEYLRIVLEES